MNYSALLAPLLAVMALTQAASPAAPSAPAASAAAPAAATQVSATASSATAATTAASAASTAAPAAAASIIDATGRPVGTATFTGLASGATKVEVRVSGFDPGPGGDHGLHIHTTGRCEWPDFTSAGGHLNPAARQHGLASPTGPHAGDLPNVQFYPDGSASYAATVTGFPWATLLDKDGSAIMIHASPDDGMTDPSGNSGALIGCGVIVAKAAAGR